MWDGNKKQTKQQRKFLSNDSIKPYEDASTLLSHLKNAESPPLKRTICGLSPLPLRLNTIERVKKDSELRRIFCGKSGEKYIYIFEPSREKKIGGAIGNVYKKKHSNPDAIRPEREWLGKVGIQGPKVVYGSHKFSKRVNSEDTTMKNERGLNCAVMLEYLANCLYRLFGDGMFETTKMRLSELPLINEFTNKFLEKRLVKKRNVTKTLRVMSKWCESYTDLSELKVLVNNRPMDIIEYIYKFKTIPLKVIEPNSKNEIQLMGIMSLLSTATSIGDIDVIGVSGKNAGFIIERNSEQIVTSFRVIKVDPGMAFSYDRVRQGSSEEETRMISDPRDIRFTSNNPNDHTFKDRFIEWKNLTKNQKYEFLEVKLHHLKIINDPKILEYVINRDGKLDTADTIRLPPAICQSLIDDLRKHVERELEIYKEDLEEYKKVRLGFLKKLAFQSMNVGNYDHCLVCFEKLLYVATIALDLRKPGPKVDTEVNHIFRISLRNLSAIELERGDVKRAVKFAFIYHEVANYPGLLADFFVNLGCILYTQGHRKGIEYLQNALKILESHPQSHPQPNNFANVYSHLGDAYKFFREPERAVEFYLLALKNEKNVYPALTLSNLADCYHSMGNFAKSIEYHQRSFDVKYNNLPSHPHTASALT